ncbi:conjugal transfer protein TraM [Salmonella enterica]|nr:conjugal transfer protein TraM [Salmonella enterica]
MTTLIKKYGPAVVMGVLSIALPQIALAAGTDTGESTATSLQTWLNTWIPLGCALAIVVSCFLWMLHVIPASFIPRIIFSLIGIGSATYLVSLTGVGS